MLAAIPGSAATVAPEKAPDLMHVYVHGEEADHEQINTEHIEY